MFIGLIMAMTIGCGMDGKTTGDDDTDVNRLEPSSGEPGAGPGQPEAGPGEPGDSENQNLQGNINGTIDIQLYGLDEDLEREMLSWEESYGSFYPFGKIFVAAYHENEQGQQFYVGFDVIDNPQPTGNQYSIPVEVPAVDTDLRIFAVLDYYVDNITGNDEPMGGYTRTVSFADIGVDSQSMVIDDIDFSILSPLQEQRPPCEDSTSTDPREMSISGFANITETYTGGEIAVVLFEPGPVGPIRHSIVAPEVLGGGAEAEYTINACEGSGYMLLMGIWDENRNGMYDPMDEFGVYISEPNQTGNPVTIGYSDLSNYEIQIPFHSASGLSLVPFVQLSGTVSPSSGTFDELTTSGTLYIAALKYRPSGEISISTLEERSYDYKEVTWEDLQGQSSIDWRLTVPSETITYLWAYLDVDGNGMVNEPQEPIASGGEDDNGKFPTGNVATGNINMNLLTME